MKTDTPPQSRTRLRLLTDGHYDQRVDGELVPRRQGEVFEAVDQAEVERLIAIGAAVDVKAEMEGQQKLLDAEKAALEARAAALKGESERLAADIELAS